MNIDDSVSYLRLMLMDFLNLSINKPKEFIQHLIKHKLLLEDFHQRIRIFKIFHQGIDTLKKSNLRLSQDQVIMRLWLQIILKLNLEFWLT